MKKTLFTIVLMLFISQLFSLTIDEVKNLPYKKTDFYGGSFSDNLLDKVRVFEGNAKQFLSDFDNCYEYKNHELTTQEKDFFTEYFSYLPQKLQDCFLDHVYAVYFVFLRAFRSTAVRELVPAARGDGPAGHGPRKYKTNAIFWLWKTRLKKYKNLYKNVLT